MLYVFAIEGTQYLKVGYTCGCPWGRVRDGFWCNVHPEECCGKLGWENLRLLVLAPSTMVDEQLLHDRVGSEGELRRVEQLDAIKLCLKLNARCSHACGNDD